MLLDLFFWRPKAGGQFRRDGRLDIRLPSPVEAESDDEEIAAILAMIMPILQGEP